MTDKIKVAVQKNGILETAIMSNVSYIKSETLTETLVFEEHLNDGAEIEFDDIKTKIVISKQN